MPDADFDRTAVPVTVLSSGRASVQPRHRGLFDPRRRRATSASSSRPTTGPPGVDSSSFPQPDHPASLTDTVRDTGAVPSARSLSTRSDAGSPAAMGWHRLRGQKSGSGSVPSRGCAPALPPTATCLGPTSPVSQSSAPPWPRVSIRLACARPRRPDLLCARLNPGDGGALTSAARRAGRSCRAYRAG
jgi:hypothetical protein